MTDFRAVRTVLQANYFAGFPGQPAKDLVKKNTWDEIQILPEIVSISTSNNHGKDLQLLSDLCGHWLDILPPEQDVHIKQACLMAADKLQASTFNALHGYYQTAVDCLRLAIEQMTIATHNQLCFEHEEGVIVEGRGAASFETAHDYLRLHYKETRLWRLFEGERNGIGWIRSLHQTLTDYVYARQDSDAIQVWDGGNGPIYRKSALESAIRMWLLTYASCAILLRLAQPSTPKVEEIFSNTTVARVVVLKRAADLLWV